MKQPVRPIVCLKQPQTSVRSWKMFGTRNMKKTKLQQCSRAATTSNTNQHESHHNYQAASTNWASQRWLTFQRFRPLFLPRHIHHCHSLNTLCFLLQRSRDKCELSMVSERFAPAPVARGRKIDDRLDFIIALRTAGFEDGRTNDANCCQSIFKRCQAARYFRLTARRAKTPRFPRSISPPSWMTSSMLTLFLFFSEARCDADRCSCSPG